MEKNATHFERRMQNFFFRWTANLLLGVIIFYNAELGRMLGIHGQALSISLVWPATGFALAGLLLFGNRIWAGVFWGNFAYNLLHLYLFSHEWDRTLIAALAITLGSLGQALLGNYLIRRWSSEAYFQSVRDVVAFLIFGGLVTCLIASTIGTATLYFFGMTEEAAFNVWITFWLGDIMGVYIFTPLLVVWSIYKVRLPPKEYRWEALLMIAGFVLVSFLTFIWNYPLLNLYIPIGVWAAYRFRMQGATLAIFLIAMVAIIPTSMGFGVLRGALTSDSLIALVSFLEIIVAASLILAAAVNERELAWQILKSNNIDLQQAIEKRTEEVKERSQEAFVKEKLASLGFLTTDMAKLIQAPLKNIEQSVKEGIESSNALKPFLENKEADKFYVKVGECFQQIDRLVRQSKKILQVLQEQVLLAAPGKTKVRSININTLLNLCLNQATLEVGKQNPDFTFTVLEEFEKNVKMMVVFPEDLANSFTYLFYHAILSMKEKKDELGDTYKPVLEVHTIDYPNTIEISIKDNGRGLSEEQRASIFVSFISAKPMEKVINITEENRFLQLTLAHDIISRLYQGDIKAKSKEGEYTELTILLPKPAK